MQYLIRKLIETSVFFWLVGMALIKYCCQEWIRLKAAINSQLSAVSDKFDLNTEN